MIPFFSIIVACCEVEPYLHECLESVLSQSFSDWECLLGVETSKDQTEEICREYAAQDPRFRMFTGPRSGSCSAPRNSGIDMANGEYIIFLDGDDLLVEGGLQRLHKKIIAQPPADLYPCAIQAFDNLTGKDCNVLDNYPPQVSSVMTGIEAMLVAAHTKANPDSMMQLTLCRTAFLRQHQLKCIYGLRGQDLEFTPRAFFFAKTVLPLHEVFYRYRVNRPGSDMTSVSRETWLFDQAQIHRSHIAFFQSVRGTSDFNPRLGECWSNTWAKSIFYLWFSPERIRNVRRDIRVQSLRSLFGDGFDGFRTLLKHASLARRIAGWWVLAFARHSWMRPAAEWFFAVYFWVGKYRRNT